MGGFAKSGVPFLGGTHKKDQSSLELHDSITFRQGCVISRSDFADRKLVGQLPNILTSLQGMPQPDCSLLCVLLTPSFQAKCWTISRLHRHDETQTGHCSEINLGPLYVSASVHSRENKIENADIEARGGTESYQKISSFGFRWTLMGGYRILVSRAKGTCLQISTSAATGGLPRSSAP